MKSSAPSFSPSNSSISSSLEVKKIIGMEVFFFKEKGRGTNGGLSAQWILSQNDPSPYDLHWPL